MSKHQLAEVVRGSSQPSDDSSLRRQQLTFCMHSKTPVWMLQYCTYTCSLLDHQNVEKRAGVGLATRAWGPLERSIYSTFSDGTVTTSRKRHSSYWSIAARACSCTADCAPPYAQGCIKHAMLHVEALDSSSFQARCHPAHF